MIHAIKNFTQTMKQQRSSETSFEFFNTEGTVGASIQGIAMLYGGRKINGATISDTAITSIKTGLMGPLVGIGDSIIWAH